MAPILDASARKEATQNTTQNIIVEAGAGTGKTTLLIDRLVYLILVKKLSLEKIVALTFTEKAASEISVRLIAKLQEIYRLLLETPSEISKDLKEVINKSKLTKKELFTLIQTALDSAPRSQISTIHSFCFKILSRFPLEAGINANMTIDEGGAFQTIFDLKWSLFLEEELSLQAKNKETWLEILKVVSLDSLKTFARELCSVSFADYAPQDNFILLKEISGSYALKAEILAQKYPVKNARRILEPLLKECAKSLKESALYYDGKKGPFEEFNLEGKPSCPSNWDPLDFEEAEKIINFARVAVPSKQIIFSKSFALLKPLSDSVRTQMKAQNYITYDEIIYFTRNLLLKRPDIRYELKFLFDSFLIDEFQDTDPKQGEIILFLAENKEFSATNWRDIKLENGKLFVVGDPKQSIYRFRGADISAYDSFCALMLEQGAKKCFLQNNFRSSKEIISFVNSFGKQAIKGQNKMQPEYVEINPTVSFDNSKVEIFALSYEDEDKANSETLRQNQARIIAQWIFENVGKTKLSNGQTMQYRDIALLFRTSTTLAPFLESLKDFDIPFNIEEDKSFYTSQEIVDLINLLKLLKDTNDKLSLIAVLRSAAALVCDEDIFEMSSNNLLNIYAKTNNEYIDDIFKQLRYLVEKANRLNPLDLITEILENTNFILNETLSSNSEQAIANIQKFTLLAKNLYAQGALTLEQLLYNLDTYQKQNSQEGSAPLIEETLNTLKIMTIHKAKGIEFPVVIIGDISKEPKPNKKESSYLSWGLNLKALTCGQVQDAASVLISEIDKKYQALEEVRILYVALTRAAQRLILVGSINPNASSLAGILLGANVFPSKEVHPESLAGAKIQYIPFKNPEHFENNFNITSQNINTKFDISLWQKNNEEREKDYLNYLSLEKEEQTPLLLDTNPEAQRAKMVGTLCHKILQKIFEGKPPLTSETLALSCGTIPQNIEEEIKEAKEIVEKFLKSNVYKELKNMSCVAVEFPFSTITKEGLKNGIIDAIFRTEEGKYKIIDFKSDKIEYVTSKTVAPQYLKQIYFYKETLSKIFKEEVGAALLYLRPAEIYEIKE